MTRKIEVGKLVAGDVIRFKNGKATVRAVYRDGSALHVRLERHDANATPVERIFRSEHTLVTLKS